MLHITCKENFDLIHNNRSLSIWTHYHIQSILLIYKHKKILEHLEHIGTKNICLYSLTCTVQTRCTTQYRQGGVSLGLTYHKYQSRSSNYIRTVEKDCSTSLCPSLDPPMCITNMMHLSCRLGMVKLKIYISLGGKCMNYDAHYTKICSQVLPSLDTESSISCYYHAGIHNSSCFPVGHRK